MLCGEPDRVISVCANRKPPLKTGMKNTKDKAKPSFKYMADKPLFGSSMAQTFRYQCLLCGLIQEFGNLPPQPPRHCGQTMQQIFR
jgi:hypothetical protein